MTYHNVSLISFIHSFINKVCFWCFIRRENG